MESKIASRRLAWGTPVLKVGDAILEPPQDRFTHLVVDDNYDCDDTFVVGKHEYSLSFDVEINKATFRTVRKMFIRRIPRKKKKEFKRAFENRFGVRVKKMHFNYRVFNNQKKKRHGRQNIHTQTQLKVNQEED